MIWIYRIMCNIMEWEKPLHEHTCNYIQNWEVNNKKLVSTGKRRNSSPLHQCIQYSSMVFKPRLYRYINRIAFRLSWVSFIIINEKTRVQRSCIFHIVYNGSNYSLWINSDQSSLFEKDIFIIIIAHKKQ